MATQAQILANRENATRSTGPRTEAGKQASAANATKHGLSSADPVLAHENRDEYNQLFEKYCAELQPANEIETFLVRQMVHSRWRLQRIQLLEVQYFDSLAGDTADAASAILANLEKGGRSVLDTLQRHAAAAERSYYRAQKELFARRQDEVRREVQEVAIAARVATREAKDAERAILDYLNAPIPLPPLRAPAPSVRGQ